jgi:hypothetical protein
LWSTNDELGAGFLLPTGQVFFLGGNGQTALYAPTGTSSPGTWTTGPTIPGGFGINDAPAAMMIDGNVLCAVGSATTYNAPTYFYEYNPFSNSFTQVSGPTGTSYNDSPYNTRMLDLPDGTVLFSDGDSSQLYEYRPTGSALVAGVPTISNITENADGSYLLTGTLLNGISEGAAYGDDAQMNSNYPIIRMTAGNGRVYFARSFNWSSTGVMTGTNLVTTEFAVPAGLPVGTYSVVVVANGISSAPFSLQIPTPQGPFQITSIVGTNANDLLITWNTSGISNIVQVTAGTGAGGSFSPNDFTDLTNLVVTTAMTNFWDVGAATNSPARYYRIRSPQ